MCALSPYSAQCAEYASQSILEGIELPAIGSHGKPHVVDHLAVVSLHRLETHVCTHMYHE